MGPRGELNVVTARGTGASGLATRAARWAMVFVWTTGIARGLLEGVFSPPTVLVIAAHAAVLAGVFLLTAPSDRPLGRGRAAAVTAVALAATVVAVVTTTHAADVWLLDFSTYLLALMLARGNPAFGLAGGAGQVLFVVGWGTATAQPPSGIVAMLAIPMLSFVLGVVWRVVLRWIVARERAHRSEQARAERQAAAAEVATRRFRRELAEVRAEVLPVLAELRDGIPIDDDVHARVAVLEGTIRDRMRAPTLTHPLVTTAAAVARARGVRVALLAPASERPVRIDDDAAARIAAAVRDASDGSVVVSVGDADPTAVTIVTDGTRPGRTTVPDAVVPADPAEPAPTL
ncbi:hypothetical protein [Microbacterium sp.]|uniref:hypothetical protein n=1 Tax=Microbacterium sp. TaxID=51671 RepID=UPI001AD1D803|nr:hypothetical protein [Microbacterium sp.]MBN9192156.1 hypothetical protein [Microbacterium sp.]